jgi:hypothetical protein
MGVLTLGSAHAKKNREGFTPLFNGHNLKGFYTFLPSQGKNKDDNRVFTVEDGAVHVSGKEAGYFATEKTYEHFHLRYQIKFPPPGGNAGCLVYVSGPDQVWPTAIESQGQFGSIGDFWVIGDAALTVDGVRKTGQGDRHFARKGDPEKPIGEWNTVDVFCDGETVVNVLNGVEVNRGTNATPTKGRIAFQSEGAEVFYRNIEIKPLKKGASSKTKLSFR